MPDTCEVCGTELFGPAYIKEIVTPPEECEECREGRIQKLFYVKVDACPTCQKIFIHKLTPLEIRENKEKFGWGPIRDKKALEETMLRRAIKIQKQVEKSEKLLVEKSELDIFIENVKALPEIANAYYTPPRRSAPHLAEQGIQVLEIHIIPKGRPPYFQFENLCREYKGYFDGNSEINFLVVGKTYIMRIIESPVHLGHI